VLTQPDTTGPSSTVKRFIHSFALLAVIVVALPARAQIGGEELLQEGNGLFRSGLYGAALLRYREASAAGVDSALLHYNLGVVHYKLGQYGEAERWLLRASENPRFAAISAYNLGLTYRAERRTADAREWFRRAADRTSDRRLRRLAEGAAMSIGVDSRASASARAVSDPRLPIRKHGADARIGQFRLLTIARLGQDDNVYRAPSAPYVDLAAAGQPTVTPVVQSASFMPVDLVAEYVLENEAGDTDFIFGYRMQGDFYDSEFSNANRVSQRFDIGADIVLAEEGNRRRTVESAFFILNHQETNFDPDDGLDRDISGVDISDQFAYRGAGAEGEFAHTLGAWQWGFDIRLERREYEDVPLVANYDHEFYFTRAEVEYAFNDATSLSFGLRRYRRLYDERLARDLNGDLLITNPSLRYDYRGVQLGFERQLTRSFTIHLDYLLLDRVDEFLGYYDYTQNVVRLRGTFRPNRRLYLSIGAVSRTYDYPNAFAFNEPVAGLRELDGTDAELHMEYRITNKLSIWGAIEVTDVTSSDARSQYSRSVSMLGMKWRH